jgi:hypothetical protein
LTFKRSKLKPDAKPACMLIGIKLETILRQLPTTGPLFPYWGKMTANSRAAEFRRRCKILGFEKGISLHSYRYAWAQRAAQCGVPERFAQGALGHASKAVHCAYAKGAEIVCPPIETFQGAQIEEPQSNIIYLTKTNRVVAF